MSLRRVFLAALVPTGALAVAVAASGASEQQPLSREAAVVKAAARHAAFARPQRASDLFVSRSENPAHQQAAVDIAESSRRAFVDSRGEAFVFLNNDNAVCLEWRPLNVDVAASSCSPVDSPNPPGVVISTDGTMNNPLIAGMLPAGAGTVTVTQADGRVVEAPVSDGVYVYQGPTPFVVRWEGPGGGIHTHRVQPLPAGPLKPNS